MQFSGQILKMISQNGQPIQYFLNLNGDLLNINQLFGKVFKINHIGYQCVNCGSDEKLYRMGFCKKCFFESPYASESIIRPELSMAHLGLAERDLEVEKSIQLVPHVVYLSYTGDVKVGVTRASQIPTRWIDQGATLALPIAITENRYEAGMIEVELKNHLSDKTNFRKMLQENNDDAIDLEKVRAEVLGYFPDSFKKFAITDENVVRLDYPYEAPQKVNAFTLDKKPEFEGVLQGVKGQYLKFEGDNFMNIRSHEGYVVDLTIS